VESLKIFLSFFKSIKLTDRTDDAVHNFSPAKASGFHHMANRSPHLRLRKTEQVRPLARIAAIKQAHRFYDGDATLARRDHHQSAPA